MKIPDLGLLIPALLLSIIGLIVVFSISPANFSSQFVFLMLGLVLFVLIANLDFKLILAFSTWLYIATVIALVLTLVVGTVTRGSTRWLPIGSYRLQVSEFMKPVLLVVLAQLSTLFNLRKFPRFLASLLVLGVPAMLVFLQPDLGTTVMLSVVGGMGILAIRPRKRFVFMMLLLVLLISPVAWNMLADYQKNRVTTFFNPDADPLGSSYNQIQATIAAGSGKIWGKGLGRGTQSHLQFLPEKQTDFFFASMGEEFGFVGSVTVIGLLFVLSSRLIMLAGMTDQTSHRVVFLGVFVMVFIQSVVHIGINLGSLPVTGLTLPLMSVGGSSVLATWIGLGVAASAAHAIKSDRAIFLN